MILTCAKGLASLVRGCGGGWWVVGTVVVLDMVQQKLLLAEALVTLRALEGVVILFHAEGFWGDHWKRGDQQPRSLRHHWNKAWKTRHRRNKMSWVEDVRYTKNNLIRINRFFIFTAEFFCYTNWVPIQKASDMKCIYWKMALKIKMKWYGFKAASKSYSTDSHPAALDRVDGASQFTTQR